MMEERPQQQGGLQDRPRYATLQDYSRVLRHHRLLIALVTLGFVLLSLSSSLGQEPTYSASASLSFRDVAQDLTLVGIDTVPEQSPAVRAAANAELITSQEVARRAHRALDTELSVDRLVNAVTARVGTQTQFVIIEAEDSKAEFAARVANAFADQAAVVAERDARKRISRTKDGILDELEVIRDSKDPSEAVRFAVLQQQLSRIQTLSDIADPVQIVERAEEPNSPVSPKPVRNTILGGIVGLVFGLIAAFVRDSLDRRLHSVHDVHQELGLPVVGRVADTAFGYPGLARNGRGTMNELDFEAFRVLRQNLAFLGDGRPLKSVLVTSGLPEEGKSTVSMTLASAVALAGKNVLLVECDLRRPSFSTRLGVPRAPGLTDYLIGNASPQEVLHTVPLAEPLRYTAPKSASPTSPVASLTCIAAGSAVGNSAELLIGERFRAFLEKVTKAYDLVILDASPLLAVADSLEIAPQMDGVLVCARVQRVTREEAHAARAALGNLRDQPIGLVVTGLKRGSGGSYEYYYGT